MNDVLNQIDSINGRNADYLKAKADVMSEVGYVQKGGRVGTGQYGYTYAGESDLIKAIRPAMIKAGLVIAPVRMEILNFGTYTSAKGQSFNHCIVSVVYRMSHAPSGQFEEIQALGEGSDIGDKAVAKAQTGAYKYALRQAFLIETGDDPDSQSSEDFKRSSSNGSNGTAQKNSPNRDNQKPQKQEIQKTDISKVIEKIESAESKETLVRYYSLYRQRGFDDKEIRDLDAKLKDRFPKVPGNAVCPVK